MPPVVAAVAVYLAVSEAMALLIIATTVITLASVAYSAYMMASMESPKQPDAQSRLNTVRSSVQPHRMIYGECLTGGVLVYAQSHDSVDVNGHIIPNGYITLVVAFTGHEVEEISEVWLNDKVSTDAQFKKFIPDVPPEGYWERNGVEGEDNVWVTTKEGIPAHYETYSSIEKYTGTLDQEASPVLLGISPKPSTLISQRPSSGFDDLSTTDPFHSNAELGAYTGSGMCMFNISIASVGAVDTFNWTQSKYDEDGSTLLTVASGTLPMTGFPQELAEGVAVWFTGPTTGGTWAPCTTGHSIGQSWEVRAFDGSPWTADCKLTGRSYVVVTLENSDTAFPNGLPNIRARIKGNNQIYDSRTGTTGYSDNWALCVRDYLTKPYGLGSPADEINDTAAIAAANICDELVETRDVVWHRGRMVVANSIYQKRYTINGSFTVDKTPTTIMNEILATAFGAITWTQGQYRILPAAYYAPDPTFHGMNPGVLGLTESDLRGPIKVRPMPSMKDRFNAVKGTYISPETWQPVDFPVVRNALYKSQDGGEEIPRDVQLSYVTDSLQAQRIAKIMLEKSRQGITVDFPAKWSAFPLAVGDTVPISIAYLGWDQKIFTVKDWKMNPSGGVDLQLQEEAEACYAWNSGEESLVDLAPNTLLPDPRFVPTPAGLTVGEELYATNVASIIKCRAILTWTGNGAKQYEVNYLPPNNTIWAPLPLTTDTTCVVDDVIPGTYSFRVRAMNSLGVWGDWAATSAELQGKTAPPGIPGDLAAAAVGNSVALRWSLPADIDLASVEIWRGDSADITGAQMVRSALDTSWVDAQVQAGCSYWYWVRAVDTSGNFSPFADPLEATVAEAAQPVEQPFLVTVTAAVVNGLVTLLWNVAADPQIVAYDVLAAPAGGDISAGVLVYSDTNRTGRAVLIYNPSAGRYFVRPRLADGSYFRVYGQVDVTGIAAPPSISIVVSEPNIVISWPAVPNASSYQLIIDSGLAISVTTADTSYTMPIPARDTEVRLKALATDGRYSLWTEEEISVAGIYTWNEILNFPIGSFQDSTLVNMVWVNGDTVQRPSILGGTVQAPYAANINDSDLWNFIDKLASVPIEQLTGDISWFRDRWWKPEDAWFETPAFDLGATYTGRLIAGIAKTVTDYTQDIGNLASVDVSLLDYINIDDLASNKAHVSAAFEVSTDGASWNPAAAGDWVTLRYIRLTGKILHASPMLDIKISTGYIAIDVPEVTDSGTASVTAGATTKAISFTKAFTTAPTGDAGVVICNAQGSQKAWPASVTAAGFTLHLDANPGTVNVYWFAKGY